MTLEWFSCMFEKIRPLGWPPEARKHLLAELCNLQKIS